MAGEPPTFRSPNLAYALLFDGGCKVNGPSCSQSGFWYVPLMEVQVSNAPAMMTV